MYVLEFYGKPPAAIDLNVKDRILGLPEAKDFSNWERPQPSVIDLRRKFGTGLSDDELLFRITY